MSFEMKSFKQRPLESENDVPKAVSKTVTSLKDLNIWHRVFRNEAAFSCADAAQKRTMLGARGIPPEYELKSLLGSYEADGQGHLFMAHTKGDCHFSMLALQSILRSDVIPELVKVNDTGESDYYGLVNPFSFQCSLNDDPDVLVIDNVLEIPHVFDKGLIEENTGFYTAFTNAGDYSWGVEFDIEAFIKALPNTLVAEISQSENFGIPLHDLNIHLLGGESSEYLFRLGQKLMSLFRESQSPSADWLLPRLSVHSHPEMALTQESAMRQTQVLKFLGKFFDGLCEGDFLLIPSLSLLPLRSHAQELCLKHRVTLLDGIQELNSLLTSQPEVMVLSHSNLKSSLELYTEEISWPEQEAQDGLDNLITAIKKEGAKPHQLSKLWQCLKSLDQKEVLLANTELEWLFSLQKKDKGWKVAQSTSALLHKTVQKAQSRKRKNMNALKVAVVGVGNIGKEIVGFTDAHPSFELVALVCKSRRFQEVVAELVNERPQNVDLTSACNMADVIVEAANKEVVSQIIALEHLTEKHFIPMSTGGAIDALFNEKLSVKKKMRNLRVHIPSGAIAGLDAIAAVAGAIESLTLTTTKPPAGLVDAPYFKKNIEMALQLDNLEHAETVFKGSLVEALNGFPKNINVAASLFLASDFRGLQIEIVADPKVETNTHHIACKGASFGTIETTVTNKPSTNKRTSQLAIQSGIATLRSLVNSIPALD